MREDLRAVDLGERREPGLTVRGEEVVPRPHRHVPDLDVEVVGRHDAAIEDRRRSGPVGLVVADHGEVDDDDLGAGRLEVGLRLRPQGEHRRPRLDALTGGGADARAGSGIRVLAEVHRGNAETSSGESGCRAFGQRRVRVRAHGGGARDRHPRLRAPEVAAAVGVIGDHDIEHLEQVGHRAGVRHDDVHRGHERPVAAHRDHPARGGVGAEGVVGCRGPAARPRLLAQPERRERCRGRGARAVRRARPERRGEVVRVVRALGAAVQPALHAAVRHRGHVGQPDEDAPGIAQPLDRERIAARDEVGERGGARGDGQPAHHVAVLRRVRDAVERAERRTFAPSAVGLLGLGPRIGVELDERVEAYAVLVICLDAREVGLDQRDRRRRAGLQRRAQIGDRCLDDGYLVLIARPISAAAA